MRHYKYEELNWNQIQQEYDTNKNLSIKDILIKYNISRKCIETAIKKNLFKKDNKRVHKHTEKIKQLLSKKRKEYLKNNQDKHPWKNLLKFKSKPCELLKEELRKNNISFVEEFGNFKDHNYSIDIAFPNDKIGIEINGNQHYNKDGTLKEYYKKRQEYIKSFGWKLYQIHYSLIYDKNILNLIINQIKNNIKNLNIDYSFYIVDKEKIKEKRTCKICKRVLHYDLNNDHICKKCLQKITRNKINEEKINLILNSNIDFSKFGWVTKISQLINIKYQKVSIWMKKYMPDFYKEKCFKKQFKRSL